MELFATCSQSRADPTVVTVARSKRRRICRTGELSALIVVAVPKLVEAAVPLST